jgi:peptide/nickel transport system permease protein
VILCLFGLMAVLAPSVAPKPPDTAHFERRLIGPGAGQWLGTDHLGRDVLSRVVWASRTSLSIGLLSTLIAVILGIIIGALAGFFGRFIDVALMRFTDMMLAFPLFFIAVMFLAVFGPGVPGLIFIVGATSWPPTARLVRAEFLRIKQLEFITAARALGGSSARIMVRHVLPNVVAVIVISVTLRVGLSILAEAGLSYLGLGVQPPTPSWGNIVADGREYLRAAWWISLSPGVFVFLSVMALNLVGDGLRDAFDPRMKI